MATLEIDGIGKVEVDNRFLQLTPQQQAAEVDAIAAQIKGSTPAALPLPAQAAPAQAWREAEAQANLRAANPELFQQKPIGATFGQILPLARTEAGGLKLAIPEAIEAPLATARDIITGAKTIDQIGGKEAFELGALFAGLRTPAGGTGKGIAAAAEGRAMVGPTQPVAAPPVAPAGQVQALGARPGAEAARETVKEGLKAAERAAFKEADESGAVISNARMTALKDDIDSSLAKGKVTYDPDLHPSARVPLKRLEKDIAAGDVSYNQVDRLRKLVTAAQQDLPVDKKAEMAVLGTIKSKIDEMLSGLSSGDVVAGDAAAVQSVIRANKLHSQSEKLNTITKMLDRAETTAGQTSRPSTFENALINEFKGLAKSEGALSGFSPDEQKLIKIVARGDKGEKVARRIASFAPNNVSNIFFSGGIGAQLGALAGGFPGAVVGGATTLTAGLIGKRVARAILDRNIAELEATISAGGKSSRMASDAVSKARSVQKRLGLESGIEATD